MIFHREHPGDRPNLFGAQVTRSVFAGDTLELTVRIGETRIRTRQHPNLIVDHDQAAWVELPADSCIVLPADPNVALMDPDELDLEALT